MNNCLWNNNFHEINENILKLPPSLGGVGLPDLSYKICTAKILDFRNILTNVSDQQLAMFLVNVLSNPSLDDNIANDLRFLKKLKIEVLWASNSGFDIRYNTEHLTIDKKISSKEIYNFLIKPYSNLVEKRLQRSVTRFGIPLKKLIAFNKFLWPSKKLKPYQKNLLYRLLYLGLKDRKWLFDKKLRTSKRCIFCNSSEETFEHLFFQCSFLSCLLGPERPCNWCDIFDPKNFRVHSFVCLVVMGSWATTTLEAHERFQDLKSIIRWN